MASNLLRASLLLPFIAVPSVVHANHNYQHQPNQPSAYSALAQIGAPAAAYEIKRPRHRSIQRVSSPKSCTYQGGPKSGLWACR